MSVELAQIDDRLSAIEREIEKMNVERGELEIARRVYMRISPNGTPDVPRSEFRGTQSEIAAALLRQAKKPLETSEIVDQMIAGGYKATDKKKLRISVYTALWRHKEVFEKTADGAWKLKYPAK